MLAHCARPTSAPPLGRDPRRAPVLAVVLRFPGGPRPPTAPPVAPWLDLVLCLVAPCVVTAAILLLYRGGAALLG